MHRTWALSSDFFVASMTSVSSFMPNLLLWLSISGFVRTLSAENQFSFLSLETLLVALIHFTSVKLINQNFLDLLVIKAHLLGVRNIQSHPCLNLTPIFNRNRWVFTFIMFFLWESLPKYVYWASGAKPFHTRTRQNDSVFISCPWQPSAFHLFKSNFLGTYWSYSFDFCINTTTSSRSIIFQTSGCRIFFGELIAKKNSFFGFLEGKRYIFVSCIYSRLQNANIFALLDGTPFS